MLTAGEARRLFRYNRRTGVVTRRVALSNNSKVGEVVGSPDRKGYLIVGYAGRLYRLHRVIWLMVTGEWPKCQIDHENVKQADNRWVNLREANNSQNVCNSRVRRDNMSGIKGVHQIKATGRWRATVYLSGERIFDQVFATKEEAAVARVAAANVAHGEFARM